MSQKARDHNLASQVSQADRERLAELDRLAGASSGSPSEVLDWCGRAIDHLKRDVARKGNNWNAESVSALRLAIAAFTQAAALGADSAALTRLQVQPLRTIAGRPIYSSMTAATGLTKLQTLVEWCMNRRGAQRNTPGRRGHPPLSPDRLVQYREIKGRWEKAKGAGVRKDQFCRDNRITREALETALRTCRNKARDW
jgi:hypothetical protein